MTSEVMGAQLGLRGTGNVMTWMFIAVKEGNGGGREESTDMTAGRKAAIVTREDRDSSEFEEVATFCLLIKCRRRRGGDTREHIMAEQERMCNNYSGWVSLQNGRNRAVVCGN